MERPGDIRPADNRPSGLHAETIGTGPATGNEPQGQTQGRVRVVAVTPRASVRRRLSSMLHAQVESLVFVDDEPGAIDRVATGACDLVIVERALPGTDGIDLLGRLCAKHPPLVGVIVGQVENTDDAVRAMRAGACDVIPIQSRSAQTARRLIETLGRAQRVRQHDARVDRLRKLCNKLNHARQEVSGQVGGLCNDLVEAYRDLSEQLSEVKLATELGAVLRQELDIESLLRTMLEFTLSKIGSTNAAVFLPTSSGDYSLGAYVNYDIPRESAEVMLDQLADTLAPRFDATTGVTQLCGRADMEAALGSDAHWLADSTAMVISCEHEGECLAVLGLFRNQNDPFDEDDTRAMGTIARLFAEQLGRVIHIHHRHLPKDQWGTIDSIEPGYGDDDDDFFSAGDYWLAA